MADGVDLILPWIVREYGEPRLFRIIRECIEVRPDLETDHIRGFLIYLGFHNGESTRDRWVLERNCDGLIAFIDQIDLLAEHGEPCATVMDAELVDANLADMIGMHGAGPTDIIMLIAIMQCKIVATERDLERCPVPDRVSRKHVLRIWRFMIVSVAHVKLLALLTICIIQVLQHVVRAVDPVVRYLTLEQALVPERQPSLLVVCVDTPHLVRVLPIVESRLNIVTVIAEIGQTL